MSWDPNLPSGFRAWIGERVERCAKRIILFGTLITVTGAASGVAVAYWDDLRPYATKAEIGQVAQHTYPPALSEVQGKMLFLQKRLEYLDKLGAAGELTAEQWIERPYMRKLLDELKDKETDIIKEQAKFRLYWQNR
jgi:hypothetical protein